MSKKVISVGGSLIVPNKVDVGYLTQLRQLINSYTNRYQFYLIAGGGKTARDYQDAAKQLGLESKRELDDLGIRAALLNSQLLYSIFFKERPVIIADLNAFNQSQNKIVINGFYQHGASSDRIAVEVAARVGANQVINLSNIESRPTKKRFGEYIFYLDFAGHISEPRIQKVLKTVSGKVAGLKILGSY